MFGLDTDASSPSSLLAAIARRRASPMRCCSHSIDEREEDGRAGVSRVKRSRDRPRPGQGRPRPRRRSRQAPQVGPGFAEGTRRASRRNATKHSKAPPLEAPDRQAGLTMSRAAVLHLSRGLRPRVLALLAFVVGAPLLVLAGVAACRRRSACRAGSSRFLRKRRHEGVPQRISQRARHHRARRQVRPAAQRRACG